MIIEKKTTPEFFQKILENIKTFDLRLNDFECKQGDILLLREYNPETKSYTGRKLEKKIKFVLKTKDLKFWTKEEIDKNGFIVLGFD